LLRTLLIGWGVGRFIRPRRELFPVLPTRSIPLLLSARKSLCKEKKAALDAATSVLR
jgi:hypothetical protein